jgi:plasmid stability protein
MATLTLHDVPEELVARLEERARAHGRSLTREVLAALESLEPASAGPAVAQPVPEPVNIEPTLRRMQEISAGLRAKAAADGREIRQVPPLPPMTEEEKAAERELFARLRRQFKGPPLTSEEIIAAIERDSHPPEPDRFGYRINPES